jgi:hypothetical protein
MKYFILGILIINFSCTPKDDKIVETFKETEECIIGEWVPENPNQIPYITYVFSIDEIENKIQKRSFVVKQVDKNGKENENSGTWDVKSVGKIRAIFDVFGALGIDLKFTNCSRIVARGRNVYIKKYSVTENIINNLQNKDEQIIELSKEEKWTKFIETFQKSLVSKDQSKLISLIANKLNGEGASNKEWIDRVFFDANYLEKIKNVFEYTPINSQSNERMICNDGLCLYFDYVDSNWMLVDVFED